MKKCIAAMLAVLMFVLTACGNNASNDNPVQESPQNTPSPAVTDDVPSVIETPQPEATPEPEPSDEIVFLNPLTGRPMDEEKIDDRPVAIMLNNLRQALPQQGIAQADIIYELLAEGGITRMLGVYQSTEGVGTIGSVRSARTYYVELALGHDAVFLHAGGSPDSYDKISEWNVTALDCVNGPYEGSLFWRDSQRLKSMSREHTVVTSGDKISALFPNYSFRKEHEAGYSAGMVFAENGTPESGSSAVEIIVPFSTYKTGVFRFNEKTGTYFIEEYDMPYIDGNTNEQVSVTNVLVLKTECSLIPGDSAGRLDIDLSGGEGWFACGGKIIPITWSKANEKASIVYSTMDGQPLTFGVGSTYVNIIPLENQITVK